MSDKHTPGPWVVPAPDSYPLFVQTSWERNEKIGALTICQVSPQAASTEANARLIAGAPELLEAARLTVLHFERSAASGNFQGDDEHEAWTALSRAIEKAHGA